MTTIEILALVGVIALCAVMIVDYVRDFVNNSGGSGADPWDICDHWHCDRCIAPSSNDTDLDYMSPNYQRMVSRISSIELEDLRNNSRPVQSIDDLIG